MPVLRRIVTLLAALAAAAGALAQAQAAPACPSVTAGVTACTFTGYDYSQVSGTPGTITATCRGSSEHTYLFVENSLWDDGRVNESQVEAVLTAFDPLPPEDVAAGIHAHVTDAFGPPPAHFASGERLYLVIQDPEEALDGKGYAYFRIDDVATERYGDPKPGSNEHDVLFIPGLNLGQTTERNARLADLTRVFTRMVLWNVEHGDEPWEDKNDEPWVLETIARYMEFLMGYDVPLADIEDYSKDPEAPLVVATETALVKVSPGAATLFGVFIGEKHGLDFMLSWAERENEGLLGFEDALATADVTDRTFCDYLYEFSVRNGINRGEFRYASLTLPPFTKTVIREHPDEVQPFIGQYAASYLDIDAEPVRPGQALEVTLQFPDVRDLRVTAASIDKDDTDAFSLRELDVLAGEQNTFVFDELGGVYEKLILIASLCRASDPILFTVGTAITGEATDGDADGDAGDGDGTATDGDGTPTDGDGVSPDGDETPSDGDGANPSDGDEGSSTDGDAAQPDGDEGPILSGSYTCKQINACYTETLCLQDAACQANCVAQGTLEAQEQWAGYTRCITGSNPEGIDCQSLPNPNDRERCLYRNCHTQVANCGIQEEEGALTSEDVGGSSCASAGASASGSLLVLLSLAGLFLRRARHA